MLAAIKMRRLCLHDLASSFATSLVSTFFFSHPSFSYLPFFQPCPFGTFVLAGIRERVLQSTIIHIISSRNPFFCFSSNIFFEPGILYCHSTMSIINRPVSTS
jgi:hypothetical protein